MSSKQEHLDDREGGGRKTAAARAAFLESFEHAVDPDQSLDPAVRAERAEAARREHFAELGRKSGEARRRQSEVVSDLLERTRTKRGMALVIDDPETIAKVSAILASSGGDAA